MGTPGYSTFDWTDAATDKAVAMWADGSSAAEIARELGDGLTRNGVLGKLHRLKARQGVRAKPVTVKSREWRGDDERAADRGQLSRQRAKKAHGGSMPRAGGLRDLVAEQRAKKVAKVQGAGGGLSPRAGGLAAMRFGTGVASEPLPPHAELLVGPAFAPLPGFDPVRLEDHQNHQCRWPIDVEGERRARCCGAPRDGEHVYCASHRQRGVSAMTPPRPGHLGLTELQTRKRSA